MKPKTILQKQVVELSKRLRPITDKQIQWGYDNCLDDNAVRSKKLLYCLECGHSWKEDNELFSNVLGCTCPECGKELKVHDKLSSEAAYYAILTTVKGFQVARIYWAQKQYSKNKPAYYVSMEVMQHWIDTTGKVTTIQRKVQGLSRYYDQWVWDSELEVRAGTSYGASMRYDIRPYKIYPQRTILPEIKRNGFSGNFHDFAPHKFFSLILSVKQAETLLKSKQISVLKCIAFRPEVVEKYWPTIRICIRNGYIVQNGSDYFDYLDLLSFFGKDLRNSFYVCPESLKKAHDRFVNKKKEFDKKTKLEQQIAKAKEDQREYEKMKGAFFGLQFSDSELTVKVIDNVFDFMAEGEEHGHCVYSNEYHKKDDSLILSAQVEAKRLETVEVSLKELKVVQARGKGNKSTEYHDRIVTLVNSNVYQIQKIISNAVSV